MAVTATILCNTVVYAVGEKNSSNQFILDPVIVTATRSEKHELDVPGSTIVLTNKDLVNTGMKNVQEALGRVSGIIYKTFAPGGGAMGTMMNEVSIRGIDNGTLIMLNGSPLNLRGKYYLDGIPIDSVERIEIIKGGSSVLYGSEAMAGVINIITKKEVPTAVTIGYGNYGQQKYTMMTGNEKISVGANLEKWGSVNTISRSNTQGLKHTDLISSQKNNVFLNYNINDNLIFAYNHYETDVRYNTWFDEAYKQVPIGGALQQNRKYMSKEDIAQFIYDGKKNGWKGNFFINRNHLTADGFTKFTTSGKKSNSIYDTDEVNRNIGGDIQRQWNLSERRSLIIGGDFQRETYDQYSSIDTGRNIFAVFGQYDQDLTEKDEVIMGVRRTWTTGGYRNQNYRNISLSGQYLHHINNNDSLYASVMQSFIMPTFAQMYGASESAVSNPNLKPQKGISYEAGWKRMMKSYTLKAAIYHIDITDNITSVWSPDKNTYQYNNEDFKNTGVEVSGTIKNNKKLTFNWGVNYNNPLVKGSGASPKKPYWDRKFGRLQINGGVLYEYEKWSASLEGTYLGRRVAAPTGRHSYEIKPYFLTSMVVAYRPNTNDTITFSVDNLLNREDNLAHTGSEYYSAPINYLLSYKHTF